MIPKTIHYCWLSNDPIPSDLQGYMKTWKEKLPEYEFILWNFDRFDINSSLWVKQAFEAKKYAFAADYIRLFAVYNYGGIYMDMDIEVLRSFNDLLNSPLMLAYENDTKTGIEAGVFGAEKGNALIGECLSYYSNRQFIKENGSYDTLPLPQIMIKYVSKHPEITPLTKEYLTCKSTIDGVITTTKNSYCIHNFAGSWVDAYYKILNEKLRNIYRRFGKNIISKIIAYLYAGMYRLRVMGFNSTLAYYFKKRK